MSRGVGGRRGRDGLDSSRQGQPAKNYLGLREQSGGCAVDESVAYAWPDMFSKSSFRKTSGSSPSAISAQIS